MPRSALILLTLAVLTFGATHYQDTIEHWRGDHESHLKADGGWLSVTGMFWLKEGKNSAGTDGSNDIVLPRGAARSGVFVLQGDQVTFQAPLHPPVTLRADSDDAIRLDDLSMFVIHRGDRYAIRLKDQQSKLLQEFTGLRWYPVREDYRVVAEWISYSEPKMLAITDVLGRTENVPSPGHAVFRL